MIPQSSKMRWDMGRSRRERRCEGGCHQPWWRRIQNWGIPERVKSCPDPFKQLLSRGARFFTFGCTVTQAEITEPQTARLEMCAPPGQVLLAPGAVTCLGITAKWVSISRPLCWLIGCKVAISLAVAGAPWLRPGRCRCASNELILWAPGRLWEC